MQLQIQDSGYQYFVEVLIKKNLVYCKVPDLVNFFVLSYLCTGNVFNLFN